MTDAAMWTMVVGVYGALIAAWAVCWGVCMIVSMFVRLAE